MVGRFARILVTSAVLAGAVVATGAVPAQATGLVRAYVFYSSPAMTQVVGGLSNNPGCAYQWGVETNYVQFALIDCSTPNPRVVVADGTTPPTPTGDDWETPHQS
jgi:hypothetical protein